MSSVRSILRADFLPTHLDLGLLIFRVWIALSLMMLHGMGKLRNLMSDEPSFRGVFGLDPVVALSLATVGEVVAPILLIVGFASRWSAALSAFTVGTAFVTAHGMKLSGQGNGELPFMYLAGMVLLVIVGPGRFSLDGRSQAA